MTRISSIVAVAAVAFWLLPSAARAQADNALACVPAGAWVDPGLGRVMARETVIADAAAADVVILGETHDNPDHHRWQLQTIAALHAQGGPVILGFEMFPRSVQPVLDAWTAGDLSAKAFLDQVGWDRVWGFDAALYMPLFDFARINRLPMVALNVDRALIARVREVGWDAIPETDREGLSDPAPPREAYAALLGDIYGDHVKAANQEPDPAGQARFIEAQLTWDRAFAEALAAAAAAPGNPLVIGIIGSGHVENGYGAPNQLVAMGLDRPTLLLPWDRGRDCEDLTGQLADAVFGLDPPPVDHEAAPWRPRLGVSIRTIDGALTVLEVVDGSAAAAAGIRAEDVIAMAAGLPIVDPDDLIAVIGRQAPGTWLPLTLKRGGESLDVVAKFKTVP